MKNINLVKIVGKTAKKRQFSRPTAGGRKLFAETRVYALNKKEENFGRIEILPFCSKKRVCAKVILEEFPLYKY